MSGGVFSAKTLKDNESKFHILQISRLKLLTQKTLSIIAFSLPDIDMSMLLLFLIEDFFSDIKLSVRLWKIENAYIQNHFNYISPFLSIIQPTTERNSNHCQLCYRTYFSVTVLKVTLFTVTALTVFKQKLLTETTGRG